MTRKIELYKKNCYYCIRYEECKEYVKSGDYGEKCEYFQINIGVINALENLRINLIKK